MKGRKLSGGFIVLFVFLALVIGIFIYVASWQISHPIINELTYTESSLKYNNIEAEYCAFFTDFNDAVYIGRAEDRITDIYITSDGSMPNLFTLVGNDNTECYKRTDYEIPTSGEITKIFIDPAVRSSNENIIYNSHDISMVKQLTALDCEESLYHIDNYYVNGNLFYFAYNDCPVSIIDNLGGYIAYINGKWIYVNPENIRNGSYYNYPSNSVDLLGIEITDSDIIEWLESSSVSEYIE